MNDTNPSGNAPDLPWPSGDHRVWTPDTPVSPGSDKAAPAAVRLLDSAVQGAHETIDRLADSAAPMVQHLGERVSAADDALQAKAGELRGLRDEWIEGARSTVRSRPLLSMAAALALGALIARISR